MKRFQGFLFPEFNRFGDLRVRKEESRGKRKCRCSPNCSSYIVIGEVCITLSYPIENRFASNPSKISAVRKNFTLDHAEKPLLECLSEYFPGKKRYVQMIVKQILQQKEVDEYR